MKLTVQIRLLPDADTGQDAPARWSSGSTRPATGSRRSASPARRPNEFEVRKFAYREVRERFGLSSQMAQLAIKAVCDVYKRDRSKRPKFRKHAAIALRRADDELQGDRPGEPADARRASGRAVRPGELPGRADRPCQGAGRPRLAQGRQVVPAGHGRRPRRARRSRRRISSAWIWGSSTSPRTATANIQRRRPVESGPQEAQPAAEATPEAGDTKGARKKLRRVAEQGGPIPQAREPRASRSRSSRPPGARGAGIALEDLDRHPPEGHGSGWGGTQSALGLVFLRNCMPSWLTRPSWRECPVVKVDPRDTSRTCARVRPLREGQSQEPGRVRLQGVWACRLTPIRTPPGISGLWAE